MSLLPDLVNNVNELGVNDLIADIDHKADKAETHAAFQGELPVWVTKSPQLRELSAALVRSRDAARGNDRDAVASLKDKMAHACKVITLNGVHINMYAIFHNDMSHLQNSGYEIKQKPSKGTPVSLLDLVPEVSVKHGASGSLHTKIKRARQSASIELMMTDQDPNIEENWTTSLGIFTKSRIDIKDLEPAKKISLRARYHEDGHAGRWSQVVTIIVI